MQRHLAEASAPDVAPESSGQVLEGARSRSATHSAVLWRTHQDHLSHCIKAHSADVVSVHQER